MRRRLKGRICRHLLRRYFCPSHTIGETLTLTTTVRRQGSKIRLKSMAPTEKVPRSRRRRIPRKGRDARRPRGLTLSLRKSRRDLRLLLRVAGDGFRRRPLRRREGGRPRPRRREGLREAVLLPLRGQARGGPVGLAQEAPHFPAEEECAAVVGPPPPRRRRLRTRGSRVLRDGSRVQ